MIKLQYSTFKYKSLQYKLNSSGPKQEPCGVPWLILYWLLILNVLQLKSPAFNLY